MSINENIESGKNFCIRWSAARYAKEGEEVSGDLFVVKQHENQVLIAVMDGLGHGEDAYEASKKAVEVLELFKGQSLIALAKKCHTMLKSTRGVVSNLAIIDHTERTLTWLGIGNVEGILLRLNKSGLNDIDSVLSCRGILGYKLPLLKASIVSIKPGDTLIFTTDGVKPGYEENINLTMSVEEIAKTIASCSIDRSDDAVVLAAQYTGSDG